MRQMTDAEKISDLDWRLLIAVDRLHDYQRRDDTRSAWIQRHVIDRLLDERLTLMPSSP